MKEVKVYRTPVRGQIKDIDGLPVPDRSLVNLGKYHRHIGLAMVKHSITLQGTRGCPYDCAYCFKIWPKSHVYRSAEHIFEEVKYYYDMGVRRFAFIDDVFNLNVKNSTKFYRMLIKNRMKVQIFFPAGIRGDILTEEYIDLMVEAGTVNMALALETASPRLQTLIRKHLDLEKLERNINYICQKHPGLILDLFVMYGFPTETEEEAQMTLDYIKRLKWLHFPYVYLLKIYPNTDMEAIAIENGVSREDIQRSMHQGWNEVPTTIPFRKEFALKFKADFLDGYFFSKERLLHVLPHQMGVLTEEELAQKYNSYFPVEIETYSDVLQYAGIQEDQLPGIRPQREEDYAVPEINRKPAERFPGREPAEDAFRVLLLDMSQAFTDDEKLLDDLNEAPLGLMYLLSYLNSRQGEKVYGKIAKSRIDFDDYEGLKTLLEDFKPGVIGIRTLTFYKDMMHRAVEKIRQWGYRVPVIVGGPYGSSDYEGCLRDPNIDLVVLGEGELTFNEVVERIMANDGKLPGEDQLKNIAGIAYAVGRTDDRPAYEDTKNDPHVQKTEEREKEEMMMQFNDDLEDE